jgi:hypothetical protein
MRQIDADVEQFWTRGLNLGGRDTVGQGGRGPMLSFVHEL